MDVSGINPVSGSAAIETNWVASTTTLSLEDLFSSTDEELMALAAKGNTQAILELAKRDAAHGGKPPKVSDQNQTATAVTLDAPGVLGLEEPDAAQAAKLLETAKQTVFDSSEEAVGNIVDKFV